MSRLRTAPAVFDELLKFVESFGGLRGRASKDIAAALLTLTFRDASHPEGVTRDAAWDAMARAVGVDRRAFTSRRCTEWLGTSARPGPIDRVLAAFNVNLLAHDPHWQVAMRVSSAGSSRRRLEIRRRAKPQASRDDATSELTALAARWRATGTTYEAMLGVVDEERPHGIARILRSARVREAAASDEALCEFALLAALHFGQHWVQWTEVARHHPATATVALRVVTNEFDYLRPKLRAVAALESFSEKAIRSGLDELDVSPPDRDLILDRVVGRGAENYLRELASSDSPLASKAQLVVTELDRADEESTGSLP